MSWCHFLKKKQKNKTGLFPESSLYNTESRSLQLIVWSRSKIWNKAIQLIPRINRKLKSTSQLSSQAYHTLPTYILTVKNSVTYLAPLWNLPWEKYFCLETTDRASVWISWMSRIMLKAWSLLILIRHPIWWTV